MKKVQKYLKALLICQIISLIISSIAFIILIINEISLTESITKGGSYIGGRLFLFFVISSSLLIPVATATGIASFVFSILLIVEHKNAKEKWLTLATGIVGLLPIPIVSIIMTIICINSNKENSESDSSNNNNEQE